MTPLETELLQQLGTNRLHDIETLSIQVFLYGVPSSFVIHGPSISSPKVSLLYFSLRRSLSSCTFSPSASRLFLSETWFPEISQAEGIFQPRKSSHVRSDLHQLSPLRLEHWNIGRQTNRAHPQGIHPGYQLSAVGEGRVNYQCFPGLGHSLFVVIEPSCEYQSVATGFRIYSYESVEVLFSDLIVIWGAWALFQDRRRVILVPFILWVAAVGES